MKTIALGVALILQVYAETLQVSPDGPLKTLTAARKLISGAAGRLVEILQGVQNHHRKSLRNRWDLQFG